MANYDADIRAHYASVATESGLSAASTMADEKVRQLETKHIVNFVRVALEKAAKSLQKPGTLADIGCGNGYTLSVLGETFPQLDLHGFEFTPELRALAEAHFAASRKATIHPADVRESFFAKGIRPDVGIVQRVLINLLDHSHQKMALANVVSSLKPGAHILFIEAFQKGLDNLNEARGEFQLAPIPPAKHNLLLPDTFFDDEPRLEPLGSDDGRIATNFLSTHYFVSRVLHDLALDGRPFSRNSMFVQFMSDALRSNVGDFSPIRAYAFTVRGQ